MAPRSPVALGDVGPVPAGWCPPKGTCPSRSCRPAPSGPTWFFPWALWSARWTPASSLSSRTKGPVLWSCQVSSSVPGLARGRLPLTCCGPLASTSRAHHALCWTTWPPSFSRAGKQARTLSLAELDDWLVRRGPGSAAGVAGPAQASLAVLVVVLVPNSGTPGRKDQLLGLSANTRITLHYPTSH